MVENRRAAVDAEPADVITASMEAAAQDRLDVVRYLVDERGAATGAKAVVPGWSRKKKRIYLQFEISKFSD